VLFCHVTTGIEGARHEDLLGKKGGDGFPHIVFMEPDGTVIAVHDGPRDAAGFAATGTLAASYLALREKAAGGDPAAKIDFLMVQLELGQAGDAEAGERLKALGTLTPEQEKRIAALRSGAAVREVMKTVTDEAAQIAAGGKFFAMKKAGRPAPTTDADAQPYWICLLYFAEEKKDVATYEEALGALKARFGHLERAKDFFRTAEETLKELKAEKK
jgi:hypothetical protein